MIVYKYSKDRATKEGKELTGIIKGRMIVNYGMKLRMIKSHLEEILVCLLKRSNKKFTSYAEKQVT